MTKRAVIYVRVSTKEQAEEGYSIPAQREACLRLVAERGWELADEFSDRGESARTADRPQLQAMLDRIAEDRSINAVVIHKLDRLARNLEDHAAIRARLRKLDIQLVSVSESLEESASGKLVEGILASIAEFYSSNLSHEVRKGTLQKIQQGGWPTIAPIGYKNIRVREEGRGGRGEAKIVPDPEQAPLVREAFECYATGEWSITQLYEHMTDRGLKTAQGKTPSRSTFADMLKQKAYIGSVVWKGVEYEGNHEPLVSKELFADVQAAFESRNRSGERQRHYRHYLRGTLYCGACGSRLCSLKAKGNGGRYNYFFCLGTQKRPGYERCDQPYVRQELIENRVEDLYGDIQLPDDLRKKTLEKLEREIASHEKRRARTTARWAKRLKTLADERDKLLRAYYADALPLETFKKEQKRIDAEVSEAETELAAAGARLESVRELIHTTVKLASNSHRAYRKAAQRTRRQYNQAFFKAVYVTDKQVSGFEYEEPFDTILPKGSSGPYLNQDGSSKDGRVKATGRYLNQDGSSNVGLVPPTGFEPALPP